MTSQSQSINATEHAVGMDGYFTLLLSNLILIASAGVYWLWLIKQVYERAKHTPETVTNCDVLTVLGMRPDNDQINDEFKMRLDRAASLFEHGYANKILVLGGKTGNNTKTEAELGRQYLLERGLSPKNLLTEGHSRHTLENLHNARRLFFDKKNKSITIITSRYHLARSERFAQGLHLPHDLCAAEEEFKWSGAMILNLLKEAYFIHWYVVGKLWAHSVNSHKSLSRIS